MPHRVQLFLLFSVFPSFSFADEVERPNILWISCEDISPHLGCFGDDRAQTPHLDSLAARGVRYTNTYTTAGVCAPCRSAIITGVYQTTLGTHHMRCRAELPAFVRPFPSYLRQAGYYCTNNRKEDYQFRTPAHTWDASSDRAHWRNRQRPDQPFFAVFNFGGCHESGIASTAKYREVTQELQPSQRQDPQSLELPPYYPDTKVVREDWKRNYELITAMDAWAGGLLAQLEEDGLADSTIVFFWSDHGVGLPRAKRWLYDSGTHIPLIVHIPPAMRQPDQAIPESINDELVSSIDFAPTVLNLAGIPLPPHFQGRAFLGEHLSAPRDYVFGARDRMDERYDIIRAVRDKRYRYIRNYEPFRPYYQYMNTPEKGATMRELRRLHAESKLPAAAQQFMAERKPREELYDLLSDPHEVTNLAQDPKHAHVLGRLRQVHLDWVGETRDLGLIPESEIARREQAYGARYEILRQARPRLTARIRETANLALTPEGNGPALAKALADADAVVRYWGAVGLGYLDKSTADFERELSLALRDEAPCVRIAASEALLRRNRPTLALKTLAEELKSPHEWARLRAAIVLDEAGEQARPLVKELQACLKEQPNKYITRVANRALNVLLGTQNQVR